MNNSHSKERGRPREFDTDTALDNAMLIFRQKGYHATSIGDLSQAMHLTTGSIYKAFSDKRTLFAKVFARYLSQRFSSLAARLVQCANGREQLAALLHFYVESVRDIEGERGCLVAVSAVELHTLDEDLASAVTAALMRNKQNLQQIITLGQKDGSINPTLDSDSTASLMLCIVLGMRVAGKVAATRPDASLIPLALKLLD
ncbi:MULTISPECIES: TetR/AcrR family transcriptional regulator [unclassified Pantoea]|uniref:TetR/AcrR family transcriptional regulator n=1 Tax=unclassified Pantoea TaxID=2630326 RepID=UPI0023DB8151|nr:MULTISPECIES: TetR/AcrR family transcriptional regulator [unclassified Pantoea]MDF2041480.1 TetR/AcrR family transcriptional regulator [Pantoea sp. Cr_R14]MDF2069717.1 TetR/AcrR family transcriptional regulator [Pantoea sp. Cr_R13]MDF2079934.1 TetR/AcrR family transcriptional regulator [Pantoea sp. Cr_R21]